MTLLGTVCHSSLPVVLGTTCSLLVAACGSEGRDSKDGGGTVSAGGTGGTAFPTSLGGMRSGDATYYAADGSGACSFDPSPGDLLVAALNFPDWAGSAWCGACADVTGPDGSVRIRVVDECPECESGDLDLSPEAFSQIAALELGRVPITWQFVACDVTESVRYRYKDGANQWWTAVQVQNSRLPVTKLEWAPDGTTWKATTRTDYNYFLDDQGFGPNPVQVRITAIDGQTLVDDLPAVEPLLVVTGKAQFR